MSHMIFTVPSLVRVFADREQLPSENRGSTMKNETFTFQVAVPGGAEGLSDVYLSAGGALAGYIRFYPVADIPATLENVPELDDYVECASDHLYPELCREDKTFSVAAGKTRGILVTVSGDLPAGVHRIPLSLKNGKETLAKTHYTLTVVDALLPETDLVITHWMHCDCIAELHGVEIFSDDFYRVFDRYLTAYVALGNNMLLVPTVTPALDTAVGAERMTAQLVGIVREGERYTFSFDKLDRYIDFAKAHGIRYFEFAHLFTQWGAKFCPKIVATVEGAERKIFGWETSSDSPEYRNFLTQYLPALRAYIERRGLEKVSYIHLSDEPEPQMIDDYERHYRFVKPLIGDLPTFDALSDVNFCRRGVVDVPVCVTSHAKDFLEQGVPHFAYYCCGPCNHYYSNRFFVMPPERTRVIGVQLFRNHAIGFLHWGYDFYHTQYSLSVVDPYTETSAGGKFMSGDSYLVYPDREKGGVLLSLRYHWIRDAFQDYRALLLAKQLLGEDATKALLSDFGIYGYTVYPHSPVLLRMFREALNEKISEALAD